MVSIRGATTVENNSKVEIIDATKELLLKIENDNNLIKDNVISILFSSTKDLNAEYPAKAARLLGYTRCGLMCFNEMDVIGSINKCIRVMILYQDSIEQKDVIHIYLREAKTLRPDLNE
ncbi:chorismate mutase [Clostridium sp. Cult2]|uniref:chorismate mutase n=1 Tax=Clostridium sp. Cult2 TaxID=2079003 RepID=UPI001F00F9CF|nr:chorismate mutase [Clostridium sp. Cult2]MCF6465126.1 chorismate mutase [Clostridium sp. Cult2]